MENVTVVCKYDQLISSTKHVMLSRMLSPEFNIKEMKFAALFLHLGILSVVLGWEKIYFIKKYVLH